MKCASVNREKRGLFCHHKGGCFDTEWHVLFLADDDLSFLADAQYWKRRYKRNQRPFEWLLKYEELYPHLRNSLPDRPFVFLDLGCGTSDVAFQLTRTLRSQVMTLQLDYSVEALNLARNKTGTETDTDRNHRGKEGRAGFDRSRIPRCFIQASAQTLPFVTGTIDVILDKGNRAKLNTQGLCAESAARKLHGRAGMSFVL